MNATIRRADLDREGEGVLAVQRAGYAVEARLLAIDALPGQHETLADLRGEEIWVAEQDGAVTAVMGLEVDDDELVIARLVIAPEHMRRGIGRALARHAVALAGGRAVRVGTAAANAPALALYASLGFHRTAERTVGSGLPYVDLRRAPRPVRPAVVLRALEPSDAADVVALLRRNRDHFAATEPLRGEDWLTLKRQRRVLETAAAARAAGVALSFGIFADGELAGRLALTSIVRGAFQNAYLGYAIDRDHTGRGIGTAAVAQAVAIAWDAGLHRVQAAVSLDNAASRRVLEKVGFRREGLAERYLQLAGRWADQELWAITTEDELRAGG